MEDARRVLIFGTSDETADFMVRKWMELSGHAIQNKGYFAAALSGGETPSLFYRRLAAETTQIEWNKIHLFLADERFVPADSADSNYHLLYSALLKDIPIPAENVHAVMTEEPDAQSSAKRYEEDIRRFFKLPPEGLPEFDLVMLGIGADGHTASLFPGHETLRDRQHLASAVIIDNVRHDRITLTLRVINNARTVVFLVTGKTKAAVLRDVVENRDHRLPASLVNPTNGELLFLVDAEAGQYLAQKSGITSVLPH